jgi:transcriptional regulator with AAA-type ATPase domain/tetratricopeptide (TPR) repeat protein
MRHMAVLGQVLGESAPIAAVREQAARLLRSASGPGRRLPPVLILGETGTGKGLLAGLLHAAGSRATGPFVDVNCAAIPETLLEAELFGYERGAFTDARQAKAGLFQAAAGGTIFLDEVGLLPPALQSKLLKVIEERSVRRLGSTQSEPLDVAIVAATSEDLVAATQQGRFRPDLYHRLAVVTLALPPLRTRGRDVLVLAEEFLARVCEDYGLPPRGLTPDAQAALLGYAWPGNVRELANVLERAALLSDEITLDAVHLGLPAAPPADAGRVGIESSDAEPERRALLDVLTATGWNFTRAATQLGLPRNTLRYRAERLGLTPEAPARRRGGRPAAAARVIPPAAPLPAEAAVAQTRRVTLLLARRAQAGWESSRSLEESGAKVASFGGRVEELGPDGLLATFGLEPDEDAPRRAAYAALAVRTLAAQTRGEPTEPPVGVALHTEFLPVIRDGDAARVEPSATAAARAELQALLETAPPGSIVATAASSRFLARRFDLAPLAAGADGPCLVVRSAEPGRTRFVGRERELRLLGECFELARAGQGQVVMVVGEPGIGKSRLLHEFRRRLGRSATWVEGQALSFGRSMPFHPVIDMIRRVCRIDDADAEPTIVDKLERAGRRLGVDVGESLMFLRYLLSVDPGDPAVGAMDPGQRHAAIVEATHRLVERGSELRPHVFVVEDLHWCDAATEDWLTRLVDRIAARRVLILMTYRPGYRPWLVGRGGFHTALALSTLSGEEALRVAGGLLGVDELPAALQALVLDKAEGNPFFIEELVRSLQEQGMVVRAGERVELTARPGRVAVPDTVEEVILDRIHRLDERLTPVLDVASVVGKNVPFALLRAVTGRAEATLVADLRRLQAAGFVYETRVFPEVEYTFKHALTQDVAYGRVAAAPRRELHARIVGAIEELYRDRLEEHVERLAYHATRGERWAEAVRYARQAGAKAFDRSANREAVASFEDALAALAWLPERPETLADAIDIRLAARSALLQLAELPRIERYLREAEGLATALGDRRRLAWVWTYMTIAHLFAGDPAEALAVGERALALAEQVGDLGLRASARTPLAHACCERGDYRRAIALYRETIEALAGDLMRERFGQAVPPSLYARSIAAICLAELGEFAEAERLATEAATLTRTLDLPFGFALASMVLGHTAIVQGQAVEALQALEPALEVIEARGIPTWLPWAASLHGYALALGGRADDGAAQLERALERAGALPFLFGHAQWVAWLAHVRLLTGRLDEARRRGDEALRLSRQRGTRGYEAWALYVLAEVEAAGGPEARPAAEAFVHQAQTLAEVLGMRPLVARCGAVLNRLARLGGNSEMAPIPPNARRPPA